MALHKLNARRVEKAKPGKHSDGGGLYLIVGPGTSKRWAFIFKSGGKTREMGLGSAREGSTQFISLALARQLADEARKARAKGTDPIDARAAETAPPAPAFGAFADSYIEVMRPAWKNAKHLEQWRHTLRDHATSLRGKPVNQIETADVLAVLEPIWQSRSETASRLRGRIEAVLDAARVKHPQHFPLGWANPARWRGHLDKLLPKRRKLAARGHLAAMPYAKVSAFITDLRDRPAMTARALEFVILTAARTGEVIGAQWDEIDLATKIWIVPAPRMKAGREHRVPLSDRALAILGEVKAMSDNSPYVFSGQGPGKPMSNMGMQMLLRRMGVGHATVHGFRSSFRDWAGNETSFPREVAEAALAHAVGDDTERAYRRGDALEKRRQLMDAWAKYLNQPQGAHTQEIGLQGSTFTFGSRTELPQTAGGPQR
jgi:integrase